MKMSDAWLALDVGSHHALKDEQGELCQCLKHDDSIRIIGPIPWGHSGPLCHALSLSLSSLASWTSMRRWRATVQWQHLVNWHESARCGEWAQHFSNALLLLLHIIEGD